VPTLVVTCDETLASEAGSAKAAALRAAGVEVVPAGTTSVELTKLLETLSERNIDGVLVEGGGTVNASFLEAGLVDRVYAFLGPKLIGGADSKSPVEGAGVPRMADAVELEQIEVERFGDDLLVTGRVRRGETPCSQD
ncbi:MAG: dihydrofolate reductase family protein, partial [Clostridia bacterium]|nr:dihydrofolate reductase family protein [Clostridia bacterium]